MATGHDTTIDAGQPAGPSVAEPASDGTPKIVDKRSGRGKADFADAETYKKNPNRLSNVRWPLGQEPNGEEGSVEGDGWINVKLDVTENPDPGPNQKKDLRRTTELTLPCEKCGENYWIAGEKKAKEILEAGGYNFDPTKHIDGLNDKVFVGMCKNGHTVQLAGWFIKNLIKRD